MGLNRRGIGLLLRKTNTNLFLDCYCFVVWGDAKRVKDGGFAMRSASQTATTFLCQKEENEKSFGSLSGDAIKVWERSLWDSANDQKVRRRRRRQQKREKSTKEEDNDF